MDQPWRITLMGGLKAEQQGGPPGMARLITRFRTQKTAALLAYLAFYTNRKHPRELLADTLWPDSAPEAGRASLSMALSSLRHQLEPPGAPAGSVIIADRFAVQLNPDTVTTDVAEFEAVLQAAGQARNATERAQYLTRAVDLYQGPLLPGYYEEWVSAEQARLTNRFAEEVVPPLIQHLERTGETGAALDIARRAVSADPLREEFHRDLIRLLAALGQTDAALRQGRDLERILEQELAEKPSAATRALLHQVEREPAPGPPAQTSPAAAGPRRRAAAASSTVALPAGTVTFLLTDIEGSTALWERTGGAFRSALETHHRLLRAAFRAHGGHEVKEAGDSFLVAFERASDALACAVAGLQALASASWPSEVGPLQVRMALHTGEVELRDGEYHGLVLHRASRMLTAAHGGQALLSEVTAGLLQGNLPPGVRLSDLGVWRLRDVAEPARLFQVDLPGGQGRPFAPLNAQAGYASSLPLTFTRFFGREKEIAALCELLQTRDAGVGDAQPRDAQPRLITLTGPGGTGKTRLSVEVARRLVDAFGGAVYFVPLADLSDPILIPGAIVDALRAPRSPEQEPLEQAAQFLSRQSSLLVLDNFEQIVEGGTEVVQALLSRVSDLSVLVTSRQLLGLSGEFEYALLPLATPSGGGGSGSGGGDNTSAEQLGVYESVQLFIDRAQAVRPDFQVTNLTAPAVAALCDGLEGIPLAIELAAARAQVLTPAQMLAQLAHRFDLLTSRRRDLSERHRTLRATVDWSYQLLSPELQRFVCRLSVFRGGWTVQAAEAVCEENTAQESTASGLALDYLAQLRECSLLLTEDDGQEMRFRMLETIRQYAHEQLTERGEGEAVRERHRAFFAMLADETVPQLDGPQQATWLHRLEQDHDNLGAALEWAGAREEGEAATADALRLADRLYYYWLTRGHLDKAHQRLPDLLRHAAAMGRTPEKARALRMFGELCSIRSESAAARSHLEEALAIAREAGDEETVASTLCVLGRVAYQRNDLEAARRYVDEALSLSQASGNKTGEAKALHNLAVIAEQALDFPAARSLYEQELLLYPATANRVDVAWALLGVGCVALWERDFVKARSFLAQSLDAFRQAKHRIGSMWTLQRYAGLAVAQEQSARAARLIGAAEALRQEIGLPWPLSVHQEVADYRAAVESALGAETSAALLAEGRAMSLEQVVEYALTEDG